MSETEPIKVDVAPPRQAIPMELRPTVSRPQNRGGGGEPARSTSRALPGVPAVLAVVNAAAVASGGLATVANPVVAAAAGGVVAAAGLAPVIKRARRAAGGGRGAVPPGRGMAPPATLRPGGGPGGPLRSPGSSGGPSRPLGGGGPILGGGRPTPPRPGGPILGGGPARPLLGGGPGGPRPPIGAGPGAKPTLGGPRTPGPLGSGAGPRPNVGGGPRPGPAGGSGPGPGGVKKPGKLARLRKLAGKVPAAAASTRRRVGNAKRATVHAAKAVGRGATAAWSSRPSKFARRAAKGGWRIAWPSAAAAAAGVWAVVRRRNVGKAIANRWRRARNGSPKVQPVVKMAPAATVNMPQTPQTVSAPINVPQGGGTMARTAQFTQASAEMLGAAMMYSPEGMMEVGNDLSQLPVALQNVAGALHQMTKRANDEDPIHPGIIDLLGQVYAKLMDAAKLSEDLGPAFKSLHAVDIQRIQQPRRNEQRWDFSANKGHSA